MTELSENEPTISAPERDHLTLVERLKRQAFHFYFRIARGMTLGVRALVITPDEKVYMVRHTYVGGWYLPGGGVEVGETVETAIRKELQEEGNIELTSPPKMLGLLYNNSATKRDHVAYFLCRDWVQTAPFKPNYEIAETGFFALDDLPADTTPSTKRRIAEYLADKPLPDVW